MILDIVMLIGGIVILVVGGEILVGGAENIAYGMKISPLVVGLTVVAFGTSAPEMIISISSALSGNDAISFGNVVGSNICNLGLVMGITALIYPIKVGEKSIKIDWMVMIGSAMLFYFFISKDYALKRFEGIIFLFIIIIYTYFLLKMSRQETAAAEEKGEGTEEKPPEIKGLGLLKQIGLFVVGCVLLYVGADLLFMKGAIGLSDKLFPDNPEATRIVGLTVVALGTSLPELVASSIAALKKETDLAIGNLFGSCIFNILSILGVTSLVKDLHDNTHSIVNSDMLWMIGITVLIFPLMLIRRKIGKPEGIILLLFYVVYIGYLILTGRS